MTHKNETPILVAALLITLAIIGGAYWLWSKNNQPITASKSSTMIDLSSRISDGKIILVPGADNEAKLFSAKAIAEGDNPKATQLLSDYLQKHPNDPEAQIYLNNLQSLDHNPLKISLVLSVDNLNIGQEMLRGAAQAQTEINKKGGINQRYLHITIANDSNEPKIAEQIAQTLINNPEIIAIVGHNASNASIAAAPIYQKGQIVMVNPTSNDNGISDLGDYIFRVVTNNNSSAKSLAETFKKQNQKVAICYDSQASNSVSFQQDFVANLLAMGGQQAPTICNFSDPTFNPKAKIQEAISKGADSLLLLPDIDHLDKAYQVAKANQGKLSLYGSNTLVTIKTLQQGKAVQGLTLPVSWNPKTTENFPFAQATRQRWGGDVSWRTAGTYDATTVVATGLQTNPTRQGLQQTLSQPTFVSQTLNGKVKFLPNGDRADNAIIVQVKPSSTHETGYDFIPLSP